MKSPSTLHRRQFLSLLSRFLISTPLLIPARKLLSQTNASKSQIHKQEIEEQIKHILVWQGVDTNNLKPTTNIVEDLKLGSTDLQEFLWSCEDDFHIHISENDYDKLRTISSIVEYIHLHAPNWQMRKSPKPSHTSPVLGQYVITGECKKAGDCIDACPVDCIRPSKDETEKFTSTSQIYINRRECIDCAACVPVCDSKAIFTISELPKKWRLSVRKNDAYFAKMPRPH